MFYRSEINAIRERTIFADRIPIIQITSVILCSVLFSTAYYFFDQIPLWAVIAQGAGILVTVLNWLFLKRINNLQISASIMIASIFVIIMVNMQFLGGIDTPHFGWMFIVPILAGSMLDARKQMVFFGLTCLGAIYYFYVPVSSDVLPYDSGSRYILITRLMSLSVFTTIMVGYRLSLHRTLKALNRATREAQEANEMKSQFLANMSHELRTPLNAIIGFSETLQTVPKMMENQKRCEEYIEYINSAGYHLLNVVNDVLDMAKIESGKMQLNEEEFFVADILDNVVATLEPLYTGKRQEVLLEVSNDKLEMFADQRLVRQMAINLVSNAIKFAKEEGHIRIKAAVNTKNEMEIAVSDNGVGIDAAALKNITMPFYQSDDTYARSQDGTGLGLSLVNAMMQLHDGKLGLTSRVGEGTTATLTFPKERTVTH